MRSFDHFGKLEVVDSPFAFDHDKSKFGGIIVVFLEEEDLNAASAPGFRRVLRGQLWLA